MPGLHALLLRPKSFGHEQVATTALADEAAAWVESKWATDVRALVLDDLNNRTHADGNNHNLDNNNARLVGIAQAPTGFHLPTMRAYSHLYARLCSYEHLERAFKKARKRKSRKPYVIEFEKNLKENLLQLRFDLLFRSYRPQPLKTFIIRDPKTRKISKSEFRDRIVHHALVSLLEPIYDKVFIYDSYANRVGKGTLAAIQRFDYFKRKVASLSLSLNLS